MYSDVLHSEITDDFGDSVLSNAAGLNFPLLTKCYLKKVLQEMRKNPFQKAVLSNV